MMLLPKPIILYIQNSLKGRGENDQPLRKPLIGREELFKGNDDTHEMLANKVDIEIPSEYPFKPPKVQIIYTN